MLAVLRQASDWFAARQIEFATCGGCAFVVEY